MKTGAIHDITGLDVKTIRDHLKRYQKGGLAELKIHENHKPKSELEKHKRSIEQEFTARPPASLKEACEKIFQMTKIRRSKTRVEVFMKRAGMKFLKSGGVPAKADQEGQEEFLKKSSSRP